MLARLILTLLLAAFALPAMAASPCHDAPVVMAMAPHHSMPAMPGQEDGRHDDKTIVAHACIGCIPPSSMAPRVISHPVIPGGRMPMEAIAPFDMGTPSTPATPPPRTQA